MKRIAVAGLVLLALPALLPALVVGGCAGKPPAPVAAPSPEVTEAIGTVKGTIEQWRQAYEVRSMDALVKLYAHEPSLTVVQDGTLQLGWAPLEAALRAKLSRATAIHVRLKDLQISTVGAGAAAAVALMTRETTDGMTTITENGVLTLVLRKDDAGWVIVAEHYSYKRS
jgi:ketosteroid isomerase-like protein